MDNTSLFFLIFHLSGHNLFLDKVMIFGAEYAIFAVFILMFILAFKGGAKESKALLLSIVSLPIVILIIKLIHIFFLEPRPYVLQNITPLIPRQTDASFPSIHTSITTLIAFSYLYYKSGWVPFFLGLLILVGIGRIYVGVHYPLDILAGILVGIVSLFLTKLVINLLTRPFFH